MPVSHVRVRTATGPLRGETGAASGWVTLGAVLTMFSPGSAGNGSWGKGVTVGAILRTMSAGTYSTTLVTAVRSCAGAPSAPSRDTAEVTDTGHSSRNSTTAHRA